MDEDDLPGGWTVWHEQSDGRLVLTYRPDVFDGSAYPAACLPTLTVRPERTRGGRGRPRPPTTDGAWSVELTLEPDVTVEQRTTDTRQRGMRVARSLAGSFVAGDLDIRGAHPDPAAPFLDRIDELRGS